MADEEDCATGNHALVVAWATPTRPIGGVGALTRTIDETPEDLAVVHDAPRYPDVAVLGAGFQWRGHEHPRSPTCAKADAAASRSSAFGSCSSAAHVTFDCSSPPQTIDTRSRRRARCPSGGTSLDAIAAPSIACGGGACTVVWTESSGGARSRVFRTRATADDPSDPTSNYTWGSSGTQVGTSAGSQLLPSVAVAGTRTDVVYVNLYDNGTIDSLQTSFDGMARGDDISLIDGPPFSPAASSLGQRTDAAEIPAAPSPVLAAYFPDENGGAGTVSEAELAHGTTLPTLLQRRRDENRRQEHRVQRARRGWASTTPTVTRSRSRSTIRRTAASSNGVYTPDASWAGSDTRHGRAPTDGATVVSVRPPDHDHEPGAASSTPPRRPSSTRAARPSPCRCTPTTPTSTTPSSTASPRPTRR